MTNTRTHARTHTHTHPFNGPLNGTTGLGRYQKGKTNLNFTAARDSEWQWHQLGHMQVCTSLKTDNHASTSPLSFLQAGCPSWRPTNSVKALKAELFIIESMTKQNIYWLYKLQQLNAKQKHYNDLLINNAGKIKKTLSNNKTKNYFFKLLQSKHAQPTTYLGSENHAIETRKLKRTNINTK